MTLVQLQLVVALAEMGSVTAAAAQVGMTQSAASHALAALELELGATLFQRGRAGTTPTAVGAAVLAHARTALGSAEQIRQLAAAAKGRATGRVRVGSFPSVSARLLPGMLRACQNRYPGIAVALFEGTDDEVASWIGEGVVDVDVVTQPLPGISTVPIARDELVAVVPTGHRLVETGCVSATALADELFILSQAGCEPLIRAIFAAAAASLRPTYAVRDVATILAMVREGLGVTIVPRLNLPDEPAGLHPLPLDPRAFRHLALGHRSGAALAPTNAAFLEEAQRWALANGYRP